MSAPAAYHAETDRDGRAARWAEADGQLARSHPQWSGATGRVRLLRPPPPPITPADALFAAVPRCPRGHLLLMYADQRTGTCSRCAGEGLATCTEMAS